MERLLLAALVVFALGAVGAPPARAQVGDRLAVSAISRCPTPTADLRCRPVELADIALDGAEITLVRTVTVAPEAFPLERPLMVTVTAAASSEIRWNGVVIGRNGVPGVDRRQEQPGRFRATFVVPDRLVRPGANTVSARLSAHHAVLAMRHPVHAFSVGPYETAALPGLSTYLPALLTMGALAAAGVFFAVNAASDRRDAGARGLALISAAVLAQLGAETARTFIDYAYPWHAVRVAAVAALSAATATTAAAYAGRCFAPARAGRIALAAGLCASLCVVLAPGFDLKALGAAACGVVAVLVSAGHGLRRGAPYARTVLAGGAAVLVLMLAQATAFLDGGYYLVATAVLLLLLGGRVRAHLRGRRLVETRISGLEDRLRAAQTSAQTSAQPLVTLKDGARVHRLRGADIVFLKAADDYCEVHSLEGRALLVTTSLGRVLESLPGSFVRVHKSYVVNPEHVRGLRRTAEGRHVAELAGGREVPIGRSYRAAAMSRITDEA